VEELILCFLGYFSILKVQITEQFHITAVEIDGINSGESFSSLVPLFII